MNFGILGPFKTAKIPPLPGLFTTLGPGIVWMALAQGSGELIWWPYIIAKYGLTFLFLLLPACFLQYPLTYSIGYYTMVTGESIFQGFIRLNRFFALFLWILMSLSFLWFGAFASAGGTALAALTSFPHSWSQKGQTLFWAYLSIAIFLTAILFSKVIYNLIERVMMFIAISTVVGLVWACATPKVVNTIPEFLMGLFGLRGAMPRAWDPRDATELLTAVTFAGLGGFWTLFYSYWLRDKGVGMAKHMGRITGPTGKPEAMPSSGFIPLDSEESRERFAEWKRYLKEHICQWACPGRMLFSLLTLAFIAYLVLAVAYIYLKFS